MKSALKQPSNPKLLAVHLEKLYLRISFDCKIRAILETSREKKQSKSIQLNSNSTQAVFDETIQISMDPDTNSLLKITLIILKGTSKKMVGRLAIDINNDPLAELGENKYSLQRCPQKNVKLKMDYHFVDDEEGSENNFEFDLGEGRLLMLFFLWVL